MLLCSWVFSVGIVWAYIKKYPLPLAASMSIEIQKCPFAVSTAFQLKNILYLFTVAFTERYVNP